MLDIAKIIASIVVLLFLVQGIAYIVSIITKKTKPSRWTYLVWTITAFITAFVYFNRTSSDESSWVYIVAAIESLVILCLSFWLGKGSKTPKLFELTILIPSLIASSVLLYSPNFSAIIATSVNTLAYVILWRDMLRLPNSESKFSWRLYLLITTLNLLISFDVGWLVFIPIINFLTALTTLLIIEVQSKAKALRSSSAQ